MAARIAVLDSCFLLLVGQNVGPELQARQDKAQKWLEYLEGEGFATVVPAVAIPEIDAKQSVDAFLWSALNRVRIEAFDKDAGKFANPIHKGALARLAGSGILLDALERPAVKYDVLIAATALRVEAQYLVTANSRDFKTLLSGTSVRVVQADREDVP